MRPYIYKEPNLIKAPILISSPHSGIKFTQNETAKYKTEILQHPRDTDWYIDELYSFASELGLPMICANYSRYVIDLNRPLSQRKLYDDGRTETGLFPQKTFFGDEIYDTLPTEAEYKDRIDMIYRPYYQKITETLDMLQEKFGFAILYDGHSIKSLVPSIRKEAFPNFILGTADGASCPAAIAECFLNHLKTWPNAVVGFNEPFKGGNITRNFGDEETKIYSMQLEMTQNLYLDEETDHKSPEFDKLASFLRAGFVKLIEHINE